MTDFSTLFIVAMAQPGQAQPSFLVQIFPFALMLLIFYRQFDRPNRSGVSVDVSVNWGIFIAFLLGALLAYAGYRLRAAHVPEPVVDDAPPPEAETVPAPAAAHPPPDAPDTEPTVVARRRRPPADDTLDGQLSFDEPAEYRPPPRRG